MKHFKTWLMLIISITIGMKAHSQYIAVGVPLSPGQCWADTSSVNGLYFTNIVVQSYPSHGTYSQNVVPGTYCADSTFIGLDTLKVHATFTINDTITGNYDFYIIFQIGNCHLSISSIYFNTNLCNGGNQGGLGVSLNGGTPPYTYLWNDNETGSTHCVINPGINYCVTVTDSAGCVATDCYTWYGIGSCSFQATQVYPDSNIVSFTPYPDTSQGPVVQYYWEFGDGTQDYSSSNPVHVYPAPGNYGVELHIFYQGLDTCISWQNIYVGNNRNCNLAINGFTYDSAGCGILGGSLTPLVSGGNGPLLFSWSNGDTAQAICGVISPTAYCLTVSDTLGCSVHTCYVWPGSGQCMYVYQQINPAALAYQFTSLPDSSQTITSYLWNFGDGVTSTLANPQHTYNAAGNYMVVLTIYYAGGTFCQTNYTVYAFINSGCYLSVNFNADTAACSVGSQGYIAVPMGGTPPYTYLWNDNSTSATNCVANGTSGCVTVTDNMGCLGAACTQNINCNFSIAYIFYDSLSCGPQGGLDAVLSGGTAPYSYYWSVLGGSTSSTSTIFCGVTSGQTYCLSVMDAFGCVANSCYTVNNSIGCPFSASQTIPDSLKVHFYAFLYNSGTIATANWDFGDGTTGTGVTPIHQYARPGTYNVEQWLYYTNGDSCYSIIPLVVQPDSGIFGYCQASFTSYLDSGTNTVFFVDQSVYSPVSWAWDFGDGTYSTLQNPAHPYTGTGTWTVCLTTTDQNGCSSSYCQQVTNVVIQDVQADLFHGSTVTPGFPLYAYLGYYNAGSISQSGTLTYRYPVGTTYSTSSIAPTSLDAVNRLITFSYSNLLSNSFGYVFVELTADNNLTLGSLVYDTLWVNPIIGDANPGDNVSSIIDSVVGSWDPNNKSVSPKGYGERGDIPMSTQQLDYIIHFQNTGNAAAQNVVIRDTLSDNLDLSTVQVTGASHEHTAQLIGNVLVVSFNNINLPDSGANNAASQGYFNMEAKLKPGLLSGTQILNTAYIYFDFNQPIVTNTVVNTLFNLATGLEDLSLSFDLMPNPANNQVRIKGEFDAGAVYEVVDALGRTLISAKMPTTGTNIDVSNLNSSVYLVKIKSGQKTGIQRLVVTH